MCSCLGEAAFHFVPLVCCGVGSGTAVRINSNVKDNFYGGQTLWFKPPTNSVKYTHHVSVGDEKYR